MEKTKQTVSFTEEDLVTRKLLAWLNTYPACPVSSIGFEYLPADGEAMTLSTIQAAYMTKRYITGGYRAEYQFRIIYRVKPGSSFDRRLGADEALNALGDWAVGKRPDIGAGKVVVSIEPTARASTLALYENGDEDHQILMKLIYEVNV